MDLNVRNVPDDLVRRLRLSAFQENTTLREVVIAELAAAADRRDGATVKPVPIQTDAIAGSGGKATVSKPAGSGHALGCRCYVCCPPKSR